MKPIGKIVQLIPTNRTAIFEYEGGHLEGEAVDAIWLDSEGEVGFLVIDAAGMPDTSPEKCTNFVRYGYPNEKGLVE